MLLYPIQYPMQYRRIIIDLRHHDPALDQGIHHFRFALGLDGFFKLPVFFPGLKDPYQGLQHFVLRGPGTGL